MRTGIVVILVLLAAGCTHTIQLPPIESATPNCLFDVIDETGDPEHLYAQGSIVHIIKVDPTLGLTIKNSVCQSYKRMDSAVFRIDRFECIVAGHGVTIPYLSRIHGRLEFSDKSLEIRANSRVDGGGYVPAGCENAVIPTIEELGAKILEATN